MGEFPIIDPTPIRRAVIALSSFPSPFLVLIPYPVMPGGPDPFPVAFERSIPFSPPFFLLLLEVLDIGKYTTKCFFSQ